jgi:hypothetical protein
MQNFSKNIYSKVQLMVSYKSHILTSWIHNVPVTFCVGKVRQEPPPPHTHTHTHTHSYCTSACMESRLLVASNGGLCIQINLIPHPASSEPEAEINSGFYFTATNKTLAY